MQLKAEKAREMAWSDEEVKDVGLKIIVLEGFYTREEVQQAGFDLHELLRNESGADPFKPAS